MIWHVKETLNHIPDNVTLVAATKYFNPAQMRELYSLGIRHFGENRVEAFLEKQDALQDLDITWHIIGTLQTKKAKKIINTIDYLHSLDTIKLAEEINKRRNSPLKCFIQVNISEEESKHGLNINDVIPFLQELKKYENIIPIGFMGMAAFDENQETARTSFKKLHKLQVLVKETLNLDLKELSIGMSNDYITAIEEQSTFVRLGSVLFNKEV